VIALRHRLKVVGPHASPVLAAVVEVMAGRDWPDELLVRQSMRDPSTKAPIAARVAVADPLPAVVADCEAV